MYASNPLPSAPTPHSRALKVVASALEPEADTDTGSGRDPDIGYTVLLKLSRVIDVEEARLISERNPFLHAT
ncbi:MAG: hypothetical protein Q4G67_12265, partial [Actinomycetia bacterium]|nr:hypothetical protein [Actinomycetes bacterium]